MELAGYLVNAVVLEHRPVAEGPGATGSRVSSLYELLARHRQGGRGRLHPSLPAPLVLILAG